MSKFSLSILVLTLLLIQNVTLAQTTDSPSPIDLPTIVPASPSVSSLMSFEEVPVNYYTGQPGISIPLYSKDLGFGISMPISLNYSTTGVRINERSGWTGTGWSLQAGGVISRTVRGIPDEEEYAGLHGNKTGVFHLPKFWDLNGTGIGISKNEFMWKANGSPSDQYDYELDSYQFNVMGLSGSFVIVRDLLDLLDPLKPKLLTKNQNIKIEIEYGPLPGEEGDINPYRLNSFTLTDTNGNIYTFDKKEILTSAPFTQLEYFDGTYNTAGANEQITSTNAWHLSKVESINGNVLATLDYVNSYESFSSSYSRTDYEIINLGSDYSATVSEPSNATILKPKNITSYINSSGNTQKLTKITFNKDGSSIDFGFKALTTHPETGGSALGSVTIKDKNNYQIKKYDLDYAISASRLWLMNIEEQGGFLSNDYVLEYNDKGSLPDFASLSDDWGYNDGFSALNISNTNCAVSPPYYDYDAIKVGLLKKITYPTGGEKEFVFEQNTISYEGDPNVQGGVSLTDDEYRERNPDNWDLHTFSMSHSGTAVLDYQLGMGFTISQEQEIIFKRGTNTSITLLNGNTSTVQEVLDNSIIKLYDSNNVAQATLYLGQEETRRTIPAGTYTAKLFLFDLNVDYTINSCLTYNKYKTPIKKYVYGGGVRIKEILFNNDALAATPSRKINYHYDDADSFISPNGKSSGSIDGSLDGIVREYVLNTQPFLCTVSADPQYIVKTKIPNAQLSKGSYVGYKTVRVSEEDNGSTVYTYTSPQDYASPNSTFQHPYTPAPTIDYKRGLLINESVYEKPSSQFDIIGPILKETINEYEFEKDQVALHYALYSLENSTKQFFNYYSSFVNQVPDNISSIPCNPSATQLDYHDGYNSPFYTYNDTIFSTWVKLKQRISKDTFYDDSNNPHETEIKQEFVYDNVNFQVSEQKATYQVSGQPEELITKYYYAMSDGGYPTGGLGLFNKGDDVIATETFKNGQRLSTLVTLYNDFDPGVSHLTLPQKIKTINGDGNPPTNGDPWTIVNDMEDRVEFYDYDQYGNPLEVSKTDGTHIMYVWGYDNSYPIAQIIGHSYIGISTSLQTAIDLAILDSNNDSNSTTENTLRNSLEAIRNHSDLVDAQVSTYTYDPLVGVTSSIDTRGYKMFYQYDAFNRLEKVKDIDNNILSENEYVYGSQNYVKTTSYQVATIDGSVSDDNKIESITYLDGLGRPIQSIAKQAGGNRQDIISLIVYDEIGRQSLGYLPYSDKNQTPGTGSLSIRNHSAILSDLEEYYTNKYIEDQISSTSINAYTAKHFDGSPLNRVLELGAPGKDWLVDKKVDTDHTIKFDYQVNTSIDAIKLFNVNFINNNLEDPELIYTGVYLENELFKTITKDENWLPTSTGKDHTTEEFKNLQGQVILKRTFDSTSGTGDNPLDTYYIYDDFGNLSFVLSPKGSDSILNGSNNIDSGVLKELCYQYRYDIRNRLIEKKIPGKEWEYIVYDKLDRPILTQDKNLRDQNTWLVTKYDELDRVVYTGSISVGVSNDRSTVQTTVNNFTVLNESRVSTPSTMYDGSTFYYSNNAYPNTDKIDLFTVNYYDDYNWDTGNAYEASYTLENISPGLDDTTIENALVKTTADGWNEGFETDATISGDGYIQWTAITIDKAIVIGLTSTSSTQNYNYDTINYGLHLRSDGRISIQEDGTAKSIPTTFYQTGDVFKVERIGDQIVYKQNEVAIYASLVPSSGTLVGDGSFYNLDGAIEDVFIGYSALGQAFTPNTQGLSTGNKIRALGTDDWITNATYYDEKARPVHSTSVNDYSLTYDALSMKLDFVGKVIKTHNSHKLGKKSSPIVTIDEFKYDQTGRLIRQEQQINSQVKQLIVKNNYDELGQLEQKQVGGALSSNSTKINNIGITVLGNTIEKPTASGGGWNAVLTTQEIITGDGYLSFKTLKGKNNALMAGLAYDYGGVANSNIDYGIQLTWEGTVIIREAGVYKGTIDTYVPGDKFEIERRNRTVYYLKNGVPIYTSNVLSNLNATMIGYLCMNQVESAIKDLVLVDLEQELQEVDFDYNIRGWLKEINDVDNLGTDVFAFKLNYNTKSNTNTQVLYNGNISETLWNTASVDPTTLESGIKRGYYYDYDALNRIKGASFFKKSGVNHDNKFDLKNLTYDKNGNILTLARNGFNPNTGILVNDIDILAYDYDGNKLTNIDETGINTIGFTEISTQPIDYTYDDNGNMINDFNKDIKDASTDGIFYNHLNLPTQVNVDTQGTINYVYDATGVKLSKSVLETGNSTPQTTYYAGNFIYERTANTPVNTTPTLKFFAHPEGYVEPAGLGTFNYTYQYKDHLGNIRLAYSDSNNDGTIAVTEILEENNYYPFGLKHKGYNGNQIGTDHPYGFGGKEEQDELGLGWMDVSARNYDPALGRWMNLDPLAELMTRHSPYNYAFDNPVFFIDPDGMEPEEATDSYGKKLSSSAYTSSKKVYGSGSKKRPTAEEAARMSAHAYGEYGDDILRGGWEVSTKDVGLKGSDFNNDETGLQSALYERKNKDGTTTYVYATAGTDPKSFDDYAANGKQSIGLSNQYSKSISNANKISKALGEEDLIFTGHSLGGGTASANAIATGRKAITFNAAGISFLTKISLDVSIFNNFDNLVTAYQMKTDILSIFQDILPAPSALGRVELVSPGINNKGGHSIESMIDALTNPKPYVPKQSFMDIFRSAMPTGW